MRSSFKFPTRSPAATAYWIHWHPECQWHSLPVPGTASGSLSDTASTAASAGRRHGGVPEPVTRITLIIRTHNHLPSGCVGMIGPVIRVDIRRRRRYTTGNAPHWQTPFLVGVVARINRLL